MSAIANALRNAAGKTGDHSLLDAIGKADARAAQQKAVKKPVKSQPKPAVQFGKAKEVVVNGQKPATHAPKKQAIAKPVASAKKTAPPSLKRGEATTVKANTGKGPKSQVAVTVENKGGGKVEVTAKPTPVRKHPAKKAGESKPQHQPKPAGNGKPAQQVSDKKPAAAKPQAKNLPRFKEGVAVTKPVPHKTIAQAKKDGQEPVKEGLTNQGLEKLKAHTKQKPQQSKARKPAAKPAAESTEKKD